MKKINFAFLLLTVILYGQTKQIYVEYDHSAVYTYKNSETLIAEKSNAIYKINELKAEIKTEGNEASDGYKIKSRTGVKLQTFYKTKKGSVIYYNDYMPNDSKEYFIIDSIPKLEWKLIPNETLNIQGYVCNKAKLKYRGSNLTAYYTLEIPVSFGPWKFDGLPGLILKISSDDDLQIYWEAKKIIYPYKKDINFTYDKSKYNLTLRKFMDKKFEAIVENSRIFKAKYAADANESYINRKREYVIEKIYEWESEKDLTPYRL